MACRPGAAIRPGHGYRWRAALRTRQARPGKNKEHGRAPRPRSDPGIGGLWSAFLTVLTGRANQLFRIASGGSGIKPPGRLPSNLVQRLAAETASVADRVLHMCFRAFDYLPPVDGKRRLAAALRG